MLEVEVQREQQHAEEEKNAMNQGPSNDADDDW
jgi:hypothetical protein